jgi:hypothetical protein
MSFRGDLAAATVDLCRFMGTDLAQLILIWALRLLAAAQPAFDPLELWIKVAAKAAELSREKGPESVRELGEHRKCSCPPALWLSGFIAFQELVSSLKLDERVLLAFLVGGAFWPLLDLLGVVRIPWNHTVQHLKSLFVRRSQSAPGNGKFRPIALPLY